MSKLDIVQPKNTTPPYVFSGMDWTKSVVVITTDTPPQFVKLPREFAKMSKMVTDCLGENAETPDPEEEAVIPLTDKFATVEGLAYCLQYMEYHHNNKAPPIEKPLNGKFQEMIQEWDKKFLYTDLIKGGDPMQHGQLIKVTSCANYLNIADLKSLCTAALASLIEGKTTEEMRAILGVKNDFTKEQEDKVKRQNKYILEGEGTPN